MENINISFIQQNILYYISGYIVNGLIKKIKCVDCITILTNTNITYEHNYCSEPYSESSFMKFINRGKLNLPSKVVHNILLFVEKAFEAELNVQPVNANNFKTNII